MRKTSFTICGALLLATSLFAACGSDSNNNSGAGGGSGSGAGGKGGKGGSSGSSGKGAGTGTGGINVGGAGGVTDPGDADICGAESHTAEPTPVDIFIMLDQSTSMLNKLPNGQTLWEAVSGAVKDFVNAGSASGIGVGIQYFGIGTAPASCNVAQYATPEVGIADLPGNAAALSASLDKHYAQSFTPTGPALQGALQYAQSWAAAHPGRTTFVVLATDGYPSECTPQSMTELGAMAAAALAATPRVFTFVVGIGALWNLKQIAIDGGTREPFIVDSASATAGPDLTAALLKIAVAPLACDYPIPVSTDGGAAIPGKINVQFTPSNGNSQKLVWVHNASECSKVNNGWYYDNANSPTRIIICPDACTAFGSGTLDILLGCATITVT